MDETYLYPWTAKEAQRQGELALWRASHRANIACARAIEAAIRAYGDRETGALAPEAVSAVLDRWGMERTVFVLAGTVQRMGLLRGQLAQENVLWLEDVPVPQDLGSERYTEVDTALVSLDDFLRQAREVIGPLGRDEMKMEMS